MKIKSVRIENFRGFSDETIEFEDYTCFVGRNGSGKSTILHALNVFFRQLRDTGTDLSRLSDLTPFFGPGPMIVKEPVLV